MRGDDAASAAEPPLPPELAALLTPPTWTGSASVHTGLGYKDNLLLSHTAPERSAFARAGLELFLWHVPHGHTDYVALVDADETQYFSSATLHHESEAFARVEWRYRIEDVFSFAYNVQGYYFDHIYDVSDTDVQRLVAEQEITGGTTGPKVRWNFTRSLWIEGQAAGKRDSVRDNYFSRDVGEGTVRLGWKPGDRFEFSVGGTDRRLHYDHRPQYTRGGRAIDGTLLQVTEREGELRADVAWGAGRHWKTSTRAGLLRYADNASGFFNYRQRSLTQAVEWSSGAWQIEAEGAVHRLDYEVQTVGFGIAPPPRIKEEFDADIKIERAFTPRWSAYVTYRWERRRSNNLIDSYSVNEGLLGARWSWEK